MNSKTIIAVLMLIITGTAAKAQPIAVLPDWDEKGGADNVFRSGIGNNPQNEYVPQTDFYSRKSDSTLTILPHFQTIQQTTDWSCGDIAVLMVLGYYGIGGETEQSLAHAMHTHIDSSTPGAEPGTAKRQEDLGTSVQEMVSWAETFPQVRIVSTNIRPETAKLTLLTDTAIVGIQRVGNYAPPFSTAAEAGRFFIEQLRHGRPIIVDWTEWGGHWVDIIGYDNGGTPEYADDDILIFADPYDTFDRKHDGYTTAPLVQFFSNWIGTLGPKPWQLQPYLVITPFSPAATAD